MTRLDWIKNTQNNGWFDLLRLNLNSPYFINRYGIYIIWYAGSGETKVIKIGTGNIGDKLKVEKISPDVLRYAQFGQLKVTWAIVTDQSIIPGIVSFLNQAYTPIFGENVQVGTPTIQVNLIGK